MQINNFCDKYEVTVDNIRGFAIKNNLPNLIDKSGGYGHHQVDEAYLKSMRAFKLMVEDANISLYYQITELDIKINEAVEYLSKKTNLSEASLHTWFSLTLWKSLKKDTILKCKVTQIHWLVYLFLGRYNIEEVIQRIKS